MTNGEKMQEMFPEGKTRRCRGGVVFESDGWCHAYDSDWWNTEYKEPTTKNDSSGLDKNSKKLEKDLGESDRRMTRERIEEFREVLLPFVKKWLLRINYENRGKSDAEKFEKDFNELLDMAIISLEQEPRWIPVNERLPEENKTVIASTKYGVYPEARYSKEDGWEWAYESGADYWEEIACEVLAWMPLPQPYIEVTENGNN